MSLPPEIRLIIFEHALGGNIYPSTYYNRVTNQVEVSLGSRRQAVPSLDSPNYAVLLLNKSLREEALRAGYQGSRKHFMGVFNFRNVIHASPTSPYNLLSRIHLHLSFDQYFDFFGIATQPVIRYSINGGNASLLQSITGLKYLELLFASPYGPYRSYTPWMNYSTVSQTYPCQKTAVDCILTFAFPYIKVVPNVHLIGSIKSCTKFKWYYILGKEYDQRKEDYRTHDYNQDAEVASLLGKSLHHFPGCHCPASCVNQPKDLHAFDYDDSYVAPCPSPPGAPLIVGGRSPFMASESKPTPSSIVQKHFLWSKVLVAPPKP